MGQQCFYTNTHLQTFTQDLINRQLLSELTGNSKKNLVLRRPITRLGIDEVVSSYTVLAVSLKGSDPEAEAAETTAIPESCWPKPGTGIEIPDLLMLHPETKQALPHSWRGVVTGCKPDPSLPEEVTLITIDPPIYWLEQETPYNNVTHIDGQSTSIGENSLLNLALPTVQANVPARLMIQAHRDAFVFGTADLVMPDGVDFKSRQNHEGISMRIVRKYDYKQDTFPCRIDILYGWGYLRDEYAHKYLCE